MNIDQPRVTQPGYTHNTLTRGILPKFSRQWALCINNERNLTVFLDSSKQVHIWILTKTILFLPTGSTITVQRNDGGPWIHWMIIGRGTDDDNGRSYRARVTRAGCVIRKNKETH